VLISPQAQHKNGSSMFLKWGVLCDWQLRWSSAGAFAVWR